MPRVAAVRTVLLSAPYGAAENLEVRQHLGSGYRSTGLVEVTLEDGTTGLGEAYLAVFAPKVFVEITNLISPHVVGKESLDLGGRYREMCAATAYWGEHGPVRQVIGAIETALLDANAKRLGVPAHALLGGLRVPSIELYGSGGDSATPGAMEDEIALLRKQGIRLFKIRARNHEAKKVAWVLKCAAGHGIGIAVDMAQNLADPAQGLVDAVRFLEEVRDLDPHPIAFLEEALGSSDVGSYPLLRAKVGCKIAGGETVTSSLELCERVRLGYYDIAQPDATVIGGVHQVLEVFAACRHSGREAVVHCWGSAVCAMANYHAAFAGGGRLAEWPMPSYPLREELLFEPLRIENGRLLPPTSPGLGVRLTQEVEQRYPFKEEAIYACSVEDSEAVPENVWREGAGSASAR